MEACIVCGGIGQQLFMSKEGWNYYRCPGCKLERIYPQPTDAELTSIYSGQYYEAWGISEAEQEVSRIKKSTFKNHLKHIELQLAPAAKILDCGCATGYFMELVSEKGFKPFGVEISGYGAEKCIQKFGAGNVFHGQLEDAFFQNNPENKFDAIFMSDYLEHVRSPDKILQLASERLMPKGFLVITTPKVESLSYQLMKSKWIQYKTEHLYYFSFANLSGLLKGAGFTEVILARAYKTMSLAYFKSYFDKYHSFFFSPFFRFAGNILPSKIFHYAFKIELGDMLVIAGKRDQRP